MGDRVSTLTFYSAFWDGEGDKVNEDIHSFGGRSFFNLTYKLERNKMDAFN